ncbi:MAG TPA: diacylglycerol kinase family protein [Anaerolineales bacterium]|nr:diacylglycerol kinase family protein [Anaerolineales bacterium]
MGKNGKIHYAKLIANPGAGKPEELSTNLKIAARCLQQMGIEVDVALAKPKEEATTIARKAIRDGYKTILALGGDGTVEAVMRGIVEMKSHARLGILPYGTKNNVAKSLGIPEPVEEACALIARNSTRQIDIGQIKIKTPNSKIKKTYFFELAVIGLAAAVYPPANKVLKGQLGKIKDAAETVLQHDSDSKVFMTFDDDSRVKVQTMLVVVSNTPMFGVNFLVAPYASLEDGLLDVSVYPNFSKAELLAYYAAVMNQGDSGNDKVQHYRVHKFTLKTDPPLAVNADAAELGTGNVKIKCLGGALRVLAPDTGSAPNAVVREPVAVEVPAPLAPPATKPEKAAVGAAASEQKAEK